MNKTIITSITLILTVCVLCIAGCTTAPAGTDSLDVVLADTPVPEISYNDTPVQYHEVNGVKLGYREFGVDNNEPLLMLIGFGKTMDHWNTTFIGILSENYHVYVYDHRGMGESTDADGQFTIAQLADDAAGLITALGYDSMNTYGVSMGSSVSLELLCDHPEKVRKAVLSSATYSANIPETKILHVLLLENAEGENVNTGVRKEAVANLEWDGCYDNLSGIANDVMLITGTADIITPQSVAVDIAGQINGSWLVRFKKIPHAGSSYAPEEYGRITTTFLEINESPV
ncbi:alpha/beta fold hydrolase [Methanoplanus endosymbiosus]|uniref:Alpha/beta hydrolase n=1 Tax=Methanoplanus endosymbiosus TaxID=33865 RepID=A0A9E7TKG6_9EURY|nr:alpha/beta hydrolase [Methanoplanus endosymbiosus]UUX92610.1 alpha/beta hydrolase [Methanoplanus endosymbiosus]